MPHDRERDRDVRAGVRAADEDDGRGEDAARREGARVFWRGTGGALVAAFPTVGIYLPCYDYALEYLVETMGMDPSVAPLAAGAGSRMLAVSGCAPLELRERACSRRKREAMECTDRAVDVHSWGRCERRRVGAVVGTWARFEARGRAWDRRWRETCRTAPCTGARWSDCGRI